MFTSCWMRRQGLLVGMVVALGVGGDALAQPSDWTGPARKGRKYKVRIESAPPGAAVYLDNEEYGLIGYTPWNGELASGSWNVILKRDGYQLSSRQITVDRTSKVQETFVPMKREPPVADPPAATEDPPREQPRGERDRDAGFIGGNVRIVSNVKGASVSVDGRAVGNAPIEVKQLRPGEHVIEVRAEGYERREERIIVIAGDSDVLDLPLQRTPSQPPRRSSPTASSALGTLKILSSVPDADVFVDGKNLGRAPQERKLSVGEHLVVVSKSGHKTFERTVRIEKDRSRTVTASLAVRGGLRVTAEPADAEVLLDGEPIGNTPFINQEIPVGDHLVTVRREGYVDFEQVVTIEAGKIKVVKATLKPVQAASPKDLEERQRNLTSYAARVAPKGNSTIDFAGGYPYLINVRFTIGAGKLGGQFGFDVGGLVRSYLSRTELGLAARMNLVDIYPLSVGVFTQAGGGSNFADKSRRNTFFLDTGVAASLTGLGAVTITGRAYANFYTDRHCPGLNSAGDNYDDLNADAEPVCDEYLDNSLDPSQRMRIDNVLLDGPDSIFDRDSGARLMTSLIVEIAIKQRWNMYLAVEWAPYQDERASFTDLFSWPLLEEDPTTYGQIGFTHKF